MKDTRMITYKYLQSNSTNNRRIFLRPKQGRASNASLDSKYSSKTTE